MEHRDLGDEDQPSIHHSIHSESLTPAARWDAERKRAWEETWKASAERDAAYIGALEAEIAHLRDLVRPGVRLDADGDAHLIWWPDEMSMPNFQGDLGSRTLATAQPSRKAEPDQFPSRALRFSA